jgi:hypothetical protein
MWWGCHFMQVDHHLKANRGSNVQSVKLCNNRFTIWSAELNAPLLAINTDSTSMSDGALVLGCEALNTVYRDGRAPIQLAYLDNPRRDAKGLIKLLPSLMSGDALSSGVAASDSGPLAEVEVDTGAQQPGLPPELEAELVDTEPCSDSVDDDATAAAAAFEPAEPSPTVALTLLRAAERFVRDYAHGTTQEPLHLPSTLTAADRAALHSLADALGLEHSSEGGGHERHLVIARKNHRATGGAGGTDSSGLAADCNPAWAKLQVKYDPRHWCVPLLSVSGAYASDCLVRVPACTARHFGVQHSIQRASEIMPAVAASIHGSSALPCVCLVCSTGF